MDCPEGDTTNIDFAPSTSTTYTSSLSAAGRHAKSKRLRSKNLILFMSSLQSKSREPAPSTWRRRYPALFLRVHPLFPKIETPVTNQNVTDSPARSRLLAGHARGGSRPRDLEFRRFPFCRSYFRPAGGLQFAGLRKARRASSISLPRVQTESVSTTP